MLELPTTYLSHWLPPSNDPYVDALTYADEVLVIEHDRMRLEPAQVKRRIRYVGPVLRRFSFYAGDRQRCRASLGLRSDEPLVLMLPGNVTEKAAPSLDLVISAFHLMQHPGNRLLWVARDGDQEEVQRRAKWRDGLSVTGPTSQPDRLMAAADVAITKGTYNTTKELAALGLPSISLLGPKSR
jgi:lipid A disaccharide synthetase